MLTLSKLEFLRFVESHSSEFNVVCLYEDVPFFMFILHGTDSIILSPDYKTGQPRLHTVGSEFANVQKIPSAYAVKCGKRYAWAIRATVKNAQTGLTEDIAYRIGGEIEDTVPVTFVMVYAKPGEPGKLVFAAIFEAVNGRPAYSRFYVVDKESKDVFRTLFLLLLSVTSMNRLGLSRFFGLEGGPEMPELEEKCEENDSECRP